MAVLGFSNKNYVEAFASEQLEHRIAGHCHAFGFFGGLARAVVPDNPKTAVTRPCRYEPILHRCYQEMAEHKRLIYRLALYSQGGVNTPYRKDCGSA